jgi:enoyl-CoA hydratase/carnithine racemase
MTNPPDSGIVIQTLDRGIRQIRLARPERLNALGIEMVEALLAAIESESRAATRVLVLRGTGRAFCAGADLKQRQSMDERQRLAHNHAINRAFDALAAAPMPCIAAINGLALGGGCELALCCDLRLAGESASIGLTEARIGAIPGAGGTQRLPRLIGAARALELMLTGEPVTAARAAAIGLVQHVVDDAALDAEVLGLARLIASRSPRTARTLKRVVRAGMAAPLEAGLALEREALGEVLASPDYAEGLAAFAARRPPVFTD